MVYKYTLDLIEKTIHQLILIFGPVRLGWRGNGNRIMQGALSQCKVGRRVGWSAMEIS